MTCPGPSYHEGTAGFTLIELLVVLAIVSILATFTTVYLTTCLDRSRRSEATAFIGKLELAISLYEIDTGLYPAHSRGSASLRAALDPTEKEREHLPATWDGPYLEFKSDEVGPDGFLVDPWYSGGPVKTHKYWYYANTDADPATHPPWHNTASFDLYCLGADGKSANNKEGAPGFLHGCYCQNGRDDDGDGCVDELAEGEDENGYLEDDINNW